MDIPHVWLEVPETDVLEESRTMAMALLSEHNYEAVSEHGFTFSQRPRVYEHGDATVVVFDVDLLDTDPMYFEVNAEDLRHPLAPPRKVPHRLVHVGQGRGRCARPLSGTTHDG